MTMCSSEGGQEELVGDEEEDSSSEPTTSHDVANAVSDSPQSPNQGLSGKFKLIDIKTSGGGLSAEELQELHKTDPKKVKRILANRSSAARSKVRKLRYIAELDSKSASLHQEVTEMSAELHALQEGTARLGAENEWLFSQVVELQEQSLRLDQELETLQVHIRQSRALNRTFTTPQMPAVSLPFRHEPHQARLPPAATLDALTDTSHARIPVSAFQTVLQEPRFQPLLGLPGHSLSAKLPHAAVPSSYVDFTTPLPPVDQAGFGSERSHYAATLQSHNSSEGSGMSSTTQELRLGPEDPALLDLLRSFDLGTPRARDPNLPIPPNSLARYDRSLSLGMLGPRRRAFAYPEEQMQQRVGDLGLAMPSNLAGVGSGSLREWPQPGNQAASGPAQQGGKTDLPPLPQGLGRWPRHFSDPQAFYRSPYSGQ